MSRKNAAFIGLALLFVTSLALPATAAETAETGPLASAVSWVLDWLGLGDSSDGDSGESEPEAGGFVIPDG